jgi:tRNA modification GTPase
MTKTLNPTRKPTPNKYLALDLMFRPDDEYPIAALASGSGPGAVGVIRLSGIDCWEVVRPAFGNVPEIPERHTSLRTFKDPKNGEAIDDLVVVFFKGPRSFTGQDTVELYCHGGSYIIQRILGVLFAHGARPAQAGEFTKRALLNGKLDLTAAEGIKDLVEAQSRQQWLSGRQLYSGRLKDGIDTLRREVIGSMAYLEAMIDFPDEGDTAHVALDDVRKRLQDVNTTLKSLISTFQSGHVASRGLMVALVGAPNAGKSTLLNTLLGKQRAIVSEVAGTTRDYIEEPCLIDGRLIRLVDTAGIRDTSDIIEREGVALSRRLLEDSDVVLSLYASDSSDEERVAIDSAIACPGKPCLKLLTKSDLNAPSWGKTMLAISCKSGAGLNELKTKLAGIVDTHLHGLEERPFLTSLRQQQALIRASESIDKFFQQDQGRAGHEMLAFELQEAARAMSSVIGDISNEDILDKVFSEFCIGK